MERNEYSFGGRYDTSNWKKYDDSTSCHSLNICQEQKIVAKISKVIYKLFSSCFLTCIICTLHNTFYVLCFVKHSSIHRNNTSIQ